MNGFLRIVLTALVSTVALGGMAAAGPIDEVRALDEAQRKMVATSDLAGLTALSHANLRINAPVNRVLTREQFLKNMSTGEIAAEQFERTAEEISISGDIAVVMGRETFTPASASELGRTYGAVPLLRRYTNVYVRENGRWFWLARHANVASPPKPAGGR